MRYSVSRKTPEKDRSISTGRGLASSSSQRGSSTLYFCHYKNSMYMGGVRSFRKEGKGILLHDSGISILSSYYNDLMHGHNVFFSQHCLLSAYFIKNRIVEAAYRTDGFLLFVSFNQEGLVDGRCILFNYVAKTIVYCTFKKGVMLEKVEENYYAVINRVYELNDIDFLVGKVHAKTLLYEFEKVSSIGCQKYGNKLTFGFEKNGLINGLGFTIIFKGSHCGYNADTHRNYDYFELKVIERGYFSNSQLNGFGYKWFKNGNLYIGEFKNGTFDGNGVLKNTSKKNWVSGTFYKGNLIDLLYYNNYGELKKYDRIIYALHERKTNWINQDVHLIDLGLFDAYIEKIINVMPNTQVRSLEQRKQEVLRKIQENFVCENGSLPPSFLYSARTQYPFKNTSVYPYSSSYNYSIKKFVRTFVPASQQLTVKKVVYYYYGDSKRDSLKRDSRMLSSSRRDRLKYHKIFERSGSGTQSVNALLKVSPPPKKTMMKSTFTKKKIFNYNPLSRVSNDYYSSPGHEDISSSRRQKGLGYSTLNGTYYYRGQQHMDAKKMVGKSKIFKYLQNQSNDITPKFIYTKVDPDKDGRRIIEDSIE